MGFGKKDIVKNISSKALFSSKTSSLVLEAFLRFIKENKNHKIKISKFGTYYLKHEIKNKAKKNKSYKK
jgi:nucleoid DNA-binding protein